MAEPSKADDPKVEEKPSEDAPKAASNSNPPSDTPVEPVVVEREHPEPVVVDETNVFDLPEGGLEPGPVAGSEEAKRQGRMLVGPNGEGGQLRTPVEKGPQEGKIGVVDRELTELGEAIGIQHGVISHDLVEEGVEQTAGLPYMRCPNCGNVNIALHNKARTAAHCPACLWQSSNLNAQPNPPDRIPGVHETPGRFVDAGEVPIGKLEGALDMDPIDAKQSVPVDDEEDVRPPAKEVTTFHLDAEGAPILSDRPFIRSADDPDPETKPGHMPGNI